MYNFTVISSGSQLRVYPFEYANSLDRQRALKLALDLCDGLPNYKIVEYGFRNIGTIIFSN